MNQDVAMSQPNQRSNENYSKSNTNIILMAHANLNPSTIKKEVSIIINKMLS